VCHVPERAPESIFRLLSDGALTLSLSFPESIGEEARAEFRRRLLARLERSPAEVRPAGSSGAAPVAVAVAADSSEWRTAAGATFHAARARAEVRLHRARVTVESRPVVEAEAAAAIAGALTDLVERVALIIVY
jgi:hypothetical protein